VHSRASAILLAEQLRGPEPASKTESTAAKLSAFCSSSERGSRGSVKEKCTASDFVAKVVEQEDAVDEHAKNITRGCQSHCHRTSVAATDNTAPLLHSPLPRCQLMSASYFPPSFFHALSYLHALSYRSSPLSPTLLRATLALTPTGTIPPTAGLPARARTAKRKATAQGMVLYAGAVLLATIAAVAVVVSLGADGGHFQQIVRLQVGCRYIYTYIYIHIHIHLQICRHIFMYICIYVYRRTQESMHKYI